MKNILLIISLALSISGIAQQINGCLQLIPQPSTLKALTGNFSVSSKTVVYSDDIFKPVADLFAEESFLSSSKK